MSRYLIEVMYVKKAKTSYNLEHATLVELSFLILELHFLILWWMELVRIDYEVILMVIERGAVRSGGDRVFQLPARLPPPESRCILSVW